MAKSDPRLYAQITHDFADSPKIIVLSLEARWALLEMILYSCRMQTDGHISKAVAAARWSLDVCQELATNDPENPSLETDENGDFWIHDFAEHQVTKAEIEAKREKKRAAGRKGGRAKKANQAARTSKAVAAAKQMPSSRSSKRVAKGVAKSSKKKEEEVEEDTLSTLTGTCSTGVERESDPASSASTLKEPEATETPHGGMDSATDGAGPSQESKNTYPAAFETWWKLYPRHKGKRRALAKWQQAIKRIDPDELNEKTRRYATWVEQTGIDLKFVKYPEGWLSGDCWDDELELPQATPTHTQASVSFLDLAGINPPLTKGTTPKTRPDGPQNDKQLGYG